MFPSCDTEELEEQYTTDVKVLTEYWVTIVDSNWVEPASRHRDFVATEGECDQELIATDELSHMALELDIEISTRLSWFHALD